jgi:hypothetical protein
LDLLVLNVKQISMIVTASHVFTETVRIEWTDIPVTAILDTGRHWRTQFSKGTIQGSFQQSLVEVGTIVSEEKNFFLFHPPFFPKLLYFKPESAQIWTV